MTAGDAEARREAWRRALAPDQGLGPAVGASAAGIVRTAMAFEPRDGHLHVFMPPTERMEDYLDLVTALEDTAEELGQPIFLEGYTPPNDPRVLNFSVTPDPGVIEVNIHPSANWTELVERTEIVYEEARTTRLGAQKFMIDGRHTGTGGGNHFVLGGLVGGRLADAAPARSAEEPAGLLAQPSLALVSLLGPVHRPDQPASARRRSAQRCAARAGDRLQADRAGPADAALAGRPRVPQPAGRRDRQCPPHRVLHRQAVHARRRPPAGAGCWSCAPSRCRRTGA